MVRIIEPAQRNPYEPTSAYNPRKIIPQTKASDPL
jgi:hypothetical protein